MSVELQMLHSGTRCCGKSNDFRWQKLRCFSSDFEKHRRKMPRPVNRREYELRPPQTLTSQGVSTQPAVTQVPAAAVEVQAPHKYLNRGSESDSFQLIFHLAFKQMIQSKLRIRFQSSSTRLRRQTTTFFKYFSNRES